MKTSKSIVFVGQGPNQAAWQHGLEVGARLRPKNPEGFARDYCARIALTGAVGSKLARLLGIEVREFRFRYARRNLNETWAGKKGKGDSFDRLAAWLNAQKVREEDFERHVLLGAEVARAFGMERNEPLSVIIDLSGRSRFLLLPHPSGINQWWNLPANVEAARDALQKFLSP